MWVGPISEDAARKAFAVTVGTPELLALILQTTPGWTQNKRYSDGFHDLTAFIRSKVWVRPAPIAKGTREDQIVVQMERNQRSREEGL